MDSVLNFKWREPFVWLVPIPNRYAGELEKYHVTMTRCKEPIALWYYFGEAILQSQKGQYTVRMN